MPATKPLAIGDYGVIGDMHTAALVGRNGSIDWMCWPHFDSPSVFARILDKRAGHFSIQPAARFTSTQSYLPDTNILRTYFSAKDGESEVLDFLPISNEPEAGRRHQLMRIVRALSGNPSLVMECRPAFDYAREQPRIRRRGQGHRFQAKDAALDLLATVSLKVAGGSVHAKFKLGQGEQAAFLLERPRGNRRHVSLDETLEALEGTKRFWRTWIGKCTYHGRWQEQVRRSALTLKMMFYEPTGAMVAAPTTSLPEWLGGPRNWDYRFTWFRDSSYSAYALLRIGFPEEAARFLHWVEAQCIACQEHGQLQPVYGLRGEADLEEQVLPRLSGYRGSRPVRIGNDAHRQFQLDHFGAVVDAFYLHNKHATPTTEPAWEAIVTMLDWLAHNWNRPDQGIWEERGAPRHHVFSRIMCWVAFDRGIRIALKRGLPAAPEWREARDAIRSEVFERGWSDEVESFVNSYGSTQLDASLLIAPMVFFLSPDDPRWLATLKAIQATLQNGAFVQRSEQAPVPGMGPEGGFSLCSFWLVEALTRTGRTWEAADLFQSLLAHANPLGLFAEEFGADGELLGNYPQALTHLALISAAYNLDRRMSKTKG